MTPRLARYLLPIALLLSFSGCQGTGTEPHEPERSIGFECHWSPLRSGSIVTSEEFHADMSVSAYLHARGSSWEMGSLYFANKQVTQASGYDTGYPWLEDGSRMLSFFAVAPYQVNLQGTKLKYNNERGKTDLLATKEMNVPADRNRDVALKFRHILSAIDVVARHDLKSSIITGVDFLGLPTECTYDLASEKWEQVTNPRGYLHSTRVEHTQKESGDTPLLQQPLFLIPGKLPDDAELRIELNDSESYDIPLSDLELLMGHHTTLRLFLDEDQHLSYEVLPWEVIPYKKGFLSPRNVEMLHLPVWEDDNTTLHGTDSRVVLSFEFLRPLGVEWTATLTNGLDFEFEPGTVRRGVTTAGKEIRLSIVPRRAPGAKERQTELYISLYNREIDPDNLVGDANGPIGIGRGNRYIITQAAKE